MKALFLCRRGRGVLALVFLFAVLGVSPANGQGVQVMFANRSLSNPCGPVDAPIFGPCPVNSIIGNATNTGGNVVYLGSLLAGTGFTAALFAGPEGSSDGGLQEIGRSILRTGSAAGYLLPNPLTVPSLTLGTRPVFQVRAWDNRGGTVTSWNQVMAFGGSVASGSSALFIPPCPPALPGQTQQIHLTGLTSFHVGFPEDVHSAWVSSFTTNVVAMPGGTVTLAADVYSCHADFAGVPITWQWWRADSPIPGATNTMLVLRNVSPLDAGDYVFVIGRSSFGQQRHTMRLFVPPRLSAIQFSPPRTATLTYDTGRELKVSIEAATSFSNWVTLHTGPATGQFQDNDATNQFRHYRLRLEP